MSKGSGIDVQCWKRLMQIVNLEKACCRVGAALFCLLEPEQHGVYFILHNIKERSRNRIIAGKCRTVSESLVTET
jgi:hypothetical protein